MMLNLRALCAAVMLSLAPIAGYVYSAAAQATQVPPAKVCFQATTGITGMIGTLGTITGGYGGGSGTYGGVALTGGTGTGATANITVTSGFVSAVTILSAGQNYTVGDILSASIGVTGFSVPVASTSINSSLAGGTVGMYVPGTLTYSQTWQDASQTTPNTNPIQLDANGCAVIYGNGNYRQIVYDSLGNEIWDQLTSNTSANIVSFAGTATGTPNSILLSDAAFNSSNGQQISFIASMTNTGPVTVTIGSSGSPIPVYKNLNTGQSALVSGEIVAGNLYTLVYSSSLSAFTIINPVATTNSLNNVYGVVYPMNAPYNCVGDGVADDTICITQALTASINSSLYLGPHVYKISSLLSPTGPIHIIGTNAIWPNVCVSGFKASVANMSLLSLPFGSIMENACIEMNASGVNNSGTALAMLAGTTRLYNVWIDGACQAIDVSGNSDSIDHVFATAVGGGSNCIGVIIGRTTTNGNTVDLRFTNSTIQGNQSNPPAEDQLILDAGGLFEQNDDMLYGTIGTLIQPGASQAIQWGFFDNTVLGDTTPLQSLVVSSGSSSSIIQGLSFSNSWSASVASGDAIVIKNTTGGVLDGVNFVGHRVINMTTGNGINILQGTNISFSDGSICGLSSGQNGVLISASASRVKVNGNTIGNTCLGLGVFSGSTGTTAINSAATSTSSKIMAIGNDTSTANTSTNGTFSVNANNM